MRTQTQSRAVLLLFLLGLLGAFVYSGQAQAGKEVFVRAKPHLNFQVQAADLDMRGFTSVSGLGVEIETVDYRDGSDGSVRKLPGRLKYSNVTLKRIYRGTTDVEAWARATGPADDMRKDITVTVHDRAGRTVRTYVLHNCFPISWKLGNTDNADQVVTEEVVIAVEWFEEA